MKIIRNIKLVVLGLYALSASGQDMQFTQFYSTSLYLNPALSGANVCSRVSLTYRNQWPGIKQTYQSYVFSADHYFNSRNIGAGLFIASDVAGTGRLRTTIVNVPIAYEAKLTKTLYVRFGAQAGLISRSINFGDLTFGDQIARGGDDVATVEAPTRTRTFFDVGSGILLYSRRFWGGFAAYHLNKPNQAMLGDVEAELPIKIGIHGGAKFATNPEVKEEMDRSYISPAFNYRHQNKFDQLDVGAYWSKGILNLGLWYRGIPLFKKYAPGYANNDALAMIVGVKNERFSFAYSYDITISRLANVSLGAHELTIAYQLCKPKKKKKVRMLTPCPKF